MRLPSLRSRLQQARPKRSVRTFAVSNHQRQEVSTSRASLSDVDESFREEWCRGKLYKAAHSVRAIVPDACLAEFARVLVDRQ